MNIAIHVSHLHNPSHMAAVVEQSLEVQDALKQLSLQQCRDFGEKVAQARKEHYASQALFFEDTEWAHVCSEYPIKELESGRTDFPTCTENMLWASAEIILVLDLHTELLQMVK